MFDEGVFAAVRRSRPLSTLRGLWRHRRGTRAEIAAFQDRRLRHLVAHAYASVPYYRELFDRHGLKPGDIRGVGDLPAVPITPKRDLQRLPPEQILARGTDLSRLITRSTSGSSGEPFTIRRTWLETRLLELFRVRAMHDLGLRPSDTVATITLLRPAQRNNRHLSAGLVRAAGFYRRQLVSSLLPADAILRELREGGADVIGGLGGVVSHVARQADERDRKAIRPRFIVLGGDTVTPHMKRDIVDAFGAPVYELYTCVECMQLAAECAQTGELHTSDDGVILEVLRNGATVGEGERGEVVVTNLHAFAMPFIRYRLGDIVTKGAASCRCGSPFGTIQAVQGRMIDYFPLPGGRLIHPYELVRSMIRESEGWLRAYRLLQEREDRIVLLAVPSVTPAPEQLHRLEAAMTDIVGREVLFRVQLVPELELEKTGKFRVSRSLVRSNYDELDWNRDALDEPRTAPIA